jgi:hypothetical protein
MANQLNPATRHPVIGHYLIPDAQELLTTLRAQREQCCYHEKGILMAWSRFICSIYSRLLRST